MKKFILSTLICSLITLSANAEYKNNLRNDFLNNNSIIYGINLRNFNSNDTNGNDLIDENEESGTFINAVKRLDEIKSYGINSLHVLPITPVGKLKALGTAGSVYAISDFWSLNPQLIDKNSDLSPIEQAKFFVAECHKRGIAVIIDLPSCGAYDLFLSHPELFIKDESMRSVVPTDWTDVRLLNTGDNGNLNQDVLNAHKKFVDLVLEIGADGIRADVATIKPSEFWQELIKYTREKDNNFLYLAEASDSWREPPSKYAVFTPYDKLLDAGFDGYYGSFFNLKEWNANDFIEHVKFNQKLLSSYNDKKSVILSFTTHDELSPVILHGENFSKIIAWLEATLPFNPYSIDGFVTGDKYLYSWENTNAKTSETDDYTYFVHRGKLDIFNYSRKPDGKNKKLEENFKNAMNFRLSNQDIITKGNFISYNTNNDKIFAYSRKYENEEILVICNLDFNNQIHNQKVKLKPFKNSKNLVFEVITGKDNIKRKGKVLTFYIDDGEIKVIKIIRK